METRYNLRSTTYEDRHIPVELQLAGDGMFLSQALGSSHPEPGQVTTLQSKSTSESDSEASFVDELNSKKNSPVKIPDPVILSVWVSRLVAVLILACRVVVKIILLTKS